MKISFTVSSYVNPRIKSLLVPISGNKACTGKNSEETGQGTEQDGIRYLEMGFVRQEQAAAIFLPVQSCGFWEGDWAALGWGTIRLVAVGWIVPE